MQADLPKALRDETHILYRVVRAAATTEDYHSATVRNYAIQLNGREYSPNELEKLPKAIRPSSITNLRSETTMAFFTKYSALFNHHPSPFDMQGNKFQTMEHYLAFKKAQLSGVNATIQKAQQAVDLKEAKAILHSLREDHVAEWDTEVEGITLAGLRKKFSQNEHLLTFLKNTRQLQLGEASCNARWGIGLNLNDPNVLDATKWDPEGNLLGRCLMKIRAELCSLTETSA